MKILLPAMSILMVLCLASCKESEVKTEAQDAQPQPQKIAVTETADVQSQPQKMAVTGVHTVVIQEVIQSNSYTYLKVKEADTIHWVATGKTDIQAGETISFENPLEMKNFTSKELDRTFEERDSMNTLIVAAVDKASDPWGVKVTRYEVKNIEPPMSIKDAMEKQMRAEREKRALIAESEGDKQAKINRAEGDKQELIARSEGEKQKRINEAEGRAAEIEKVAIATATGIREIATSINEEGGVNAVNLRIAEQYLQEFGKLAKTNNTLIIPSNLSDLAGIIATASTVIKDQTKGTNS